MYPDVYYINKQFLVFDKEHALKLRKCRIVGQLVGCCPRNPHQIVSSSLPYLLSHYAVSIILSHNLANFKKLTIRQDASMADIALFHLQKLDQLREKEEFEFKARRLEELKKRNIEPLPNRIGTFDDSKMRIAISNVPDVDNSSFEMITMTESEVTGLLDVDREKMLVYKDLYEKKLYLCSGLKFGSDFLAYLGDPVRYHAQYAIRIVDSLNGFVDLTKVDYLELNTLFRLCHTANKIILLATVFKSSIRYWTLRTKDNLGPHCDRSDFKLVDLTNLTLKDAILSNPTLIKDSDAHMTKHMKL